MVHSILRIIIVSHSKNLTLSLYAGRPNQKQGDNTAYSTDFLILVAGDFPAITKIAYISNKIVYLKNISFKIIML